MPNATHHYRSAQHRPAAWCRADAMTDWIRSDYTKGEIDRAGKTLAKWWRERPVRSFSQMSEEETKGVFRSVEILENWRASHAMPLLTFRMGLTSRCRRVEQGVMVAQRMKRMSSILGKLAREETMKLSQMQDLGGCRAILSSPQAVRKVLDIYRGPTDLLFPSEASLAYDDYMDQFPKADGYRGVHIVGRYQARIESNHPWNGQRIEIQVRTRLQHAFATAVETVTTFTKEPLKFGAGSEGWRRFFALVGAAFALREGTPPVPGTPSDPVELRRELSELTDQLHVRQRLRGWTTALKQLPRRNVQNAELLLLVLDTTASTIRVTGYADRVSANEAVGAIERSSQGSHLDAVLVGVGSARTLRAAFPNYYADTHAFLESLDGSLTSL